MQIYIHRAGQQFGPYTDEQARQYLGAGQLQPDDLAWHDGAADWKPLRELIGAAPAAMAAPAAPVAAPAPAQVGVLPGAKPTPPANQRVISQPNPMRALGKRNMLIGGVICAIGTGITVVTLQQASGPEGGHYVVAWGAIIFGGIQFVKGLIQVIRG